MRGGGAGSSYNNPSGNYSQDGQDPPIDDVQGNLNGSNTPPSTWQYPFVVPKLEPIDEDRNDSGINSGSSDFHSSSPGSDTSQDLSIRTHTSQIYNNQAPIYYSPIAPKTVNSPPIMYSQPGSIPPHFTFNGHPLSPPNSEPMVSPNTPSIELPSTSTGISHNTTLTPCTSPSSGNSSPASSSDLCYPDPLSGLQNVVDRNALSPSDITPQLNNCSLSDDQKTCSEMARYDATAVPKINSHGKVKTYRCKQCNFVAITKRDYWTHAKSHMDPNKIMPCPRCDFVTEFKHHLEYHLHNHDGSKPFKCDQCNYSCVNKSMLNSHLKSHSNIYQYRCANCTYATKYCHSLKLHLRKYEHKPAMVLNPDGTPNPLPIIDVYGSRRGPKMKPQLKTQQQQLQPQPSTSCSAQARNEQQPETTPQQVLPFHLNQLMTCVSPQLPLPFSIPFFAGFPGGIPNPILMQQFERIVAEVQAAKALSAENEENQPMEVIPSAPQEPQSEVLDLSISPENNQNGKNRRKGVAVKLPPPESSEDEDDDDETTTMFSNVEVVNSNEDGKCEEYSNNNKENNFCQYCNINFGDGVLYSIHMGYHGLQDPFTCNMCGVECGDKVAFFLHVARTQHH